MSTRSVARVAPPRNWHRTADGIRRRVEYRTADPFRRDYGSESGFGFRVGGLTVNLGGDPRLPFRYPGR